MKYLVLVGLDYPTDPSIIRRLKAGEDIPFEQRKMKRAEPGEIVEDLPKESAPWLLAQGCIEEVSDGGAR